ncbi:MAG: DUF3037 domain-containing protein [Phycisphaerales bacterium]|nr:MAG: DUF3037 domain-containing protein [Phycisphaerales bacterium]
MIDYRYVLIRYVPDRERMEPVNVGLILQGRGRLDLRFSPHAAKRRGIDTAVFRLWRDFFKDELCGPAAPLFHPDRTSPEFLRYLEELCAGQVLLSRPLAFSAAATEPFEQVRDALYQRLVAPPEAAVQQIARRGGEVIRSVADAEAFADELDERLPGRNG